MNKTHRSPTVLLAGSEDGGHRINGMAKIVDDVFSFFTSSFSTNNLALLTLADFKCILPTHLPHYLVVSNY